MTQKPLPLPHFPTRFQAVVWRNWNLVPPERLAKVLRASTDQVFQTAEDLGLKYRQKAAGITPDRQSFDINRGRTASSDPPITSLHDAIRTVR